MTSVLSVITLKYLPISSPIVAFPLSITIPFPMISHRFLIFQESVLRVCGCVSFITTDIKFRELCSSLDSPIIWIG